MVADCKYNHHSTARPPARVGRCRAAAFPPPRRVSDYPHIASRQNALVRRFRDAADGAAGPLLLDGAHLVAEALDAGVQVETLAVCPEQTDAAGLTLAARARAAGARVVTVSPAVLAAISPLRQPAGLTALADRPAATIDTVLSAPGLLLVVLAGVQDPGNVGTIVRAAEALGATGVLCSEGTADPFGWKALRGSMGSALRLPIATRQPLAPAIAALRRRGARLVATVPRNATPLDQADLQPPLAILLGGEGSGLDQSVTGTADLTVSIPMAPQVESLNVAAAAALVLYEASRQRRDR
jgi:RNA methyltransferase, TrmH family